MIDILETTGDDKKSDKHAASQWLAKYIENPSVESSAEFIAWHESSVEHELAYAQCKFLWECLGEIGQDSGITQALTDTKSRIKLNNETKTRGFNWRALSAIAATIIVGVLSVVNTLLPAKEEVYRTEIGEVREVPLGDGTVVYLNTNSHIRVNFTDSLRRIQLLQGEAFFEVAKDSKRPFEVHSSSSVARAVGTAYGVANVGDRVKIDVSEGVVHLEAVSEERVLLAELVVGDAVDYIYESGEVLQRGAELDRVEAWKQNKVYFDDMDLDKAVSEFNRYTDLRIEIRSELLKEKKVSGIFNAGDFESFFFTLEKAMGVKVRRMGDRVYLYSREDNS